MARKKDAQRQLLFDSEGAELFRQFEMKNYMPLVQEVNQTRWYNLDEYLTDTYYTLRFDQEVLRNYNKLKEILLFLISIKKKYYTPQIYINDVYELDGRAQELTQYLRLIDRQIN